MATIDKPYKQPAKKAPAKKAVPAPSVACVGPSKADEMRWRAEDDLRTMQRMAELKQDPARLKAAEALIKQQLKAVQAVKGN